MSIEQTIHSVQVGIWKELCKRGETVAYPRTLRLKGTGDIQKSPKVVESSSSTERNQAVTEDLTFKYQKFLELLCNKSDMLDTHSLKEFYKSLLDCTNVSQAADLLNMFESKLFSEDEDADTEDLKLDVLFVNEEVAAGTWEDPSAPHATVSDFGLLDTPKDFKRVPFTDKVCKKTSKDSDSTMSDIVVSSSSKVSPSYLENAPNSSVLRQDPISVDPISVVMDLALINIRKDEEGPLHDIHDSPESTVTVQKYVEDAGVSKRDILCQGDSSLIPKVQRLVKDFSNGKETSNTDETVGQADVESGEKNPDAVV